MSNAFGVLRDGVKGGRWLLPWVGLLIVSGTLAYMMDSAVAGGAPASNRETEAPMECAPAALVSMTVGLDSWIVADSHRINCIPASP